MDPEMRLHLTKFLEDTMNRVMKCHTLGNKNFSMAISIFYLRLSFKLTYYMASAEGG